MALIFCPECGHKVSSAAVACPSCGHPIAATLAARGTTPPSLTSGGTQTVVAPPPQRVVAAPLPVPVPLPPPPPMPKKGKNAQGTWAIRFLGLLTLAISGGIIYQTYTNPKFKGEQPIGAWIWFGVGLFLLFVPNPERESKDSRIICPHCHVRGSVTTQLVRRKKGISGGKATAAFLTGGFSILATGLSRKEDATEATCKNCGTIWYF